MSHLRLFLPGKAKTTDQPDLESAEANILSFARHVARSGSRDWMDPLTRARVIYSNRTCPHCQHSAVEPIELQDAALNRNNMPIPGTATLVGFHCSRCRYEWPA